ncbi:MAG: homoserine O-acetyltransferase [Nitrospinae bacterium]|nr:homoserine O-acetyltransferase [Nitrospinota bacterium]
MRRKYTIPTAEAGRRDTEAIADLTLSDFLGGGVPLNLSCGFGLRNYQIAYETYGTLNAERSNAILVCHALTGDQFVARPNPVTGRAPWWPTMVGPGRPVDTDAYYVICSNVLGGCMGSAGPGAINQETSARWGASFPMVSITDMVRAQKALIDHLGVPRLHAVVGGSMGGMQALEWLRLYPGLLDRAVLLATASRQGAQGIAFHEAGRQAIMNDPHWAKGDYYDADIGPEKGLAVARMIAHITYLSEAKLEEKFGRRYQGRNFKTYSLDSDFQAESYLRHQGAAFTERFDANSYLYLTRACDYFDQAESHGGDLAAVYEECFRVNKPRVCLISYDSDWAYPPSESDRIENALRQAGVEVVPGAMASSEGHDAFLLPHDEAEGLVRYFLNQHK